MEVLANLAFTLFKDFFCFVLEKIPLVDEGSAPFVHCFIN